MKSLNVSPDYILTIIFVILLIVSSITTTQAENANDVPIIQKWSGDYPADQLNLLPESQGESRIGYLGDAVTFTHVWQVFKPGENVPEVDFSKNFVVFTRNVDFYNRTSIGKVTLKDEAAKILAVETRSARPIEDRVAMSLAVIPRQGIKFIQAGNQRIPVSADR
jgi:hypothetical protein